MYIHQMEEMLLLNLGRDQDRLNSLFIIKVLYVDKYTLFGCINFTKCTIVNIGLKTVDIVWC